MDKLKFLNMLTVVFISQLPLYMTRHELGLPFFNKDRKDHRKQAQI